MGLRCYLLVAVFLVTKVTDTAGNSLSTIGACMVTGPGQPAVTVIFVFSAVCTVYAYCKGATHKILVFSPGQVDCNGSVSIIYDDRIAICLSRNIIHRGSLNGSLGRNNIVGIFRSRGRCRGCCGCRLGFSRSRGRRCGRCRFGRLRLGGLGYGSLRRARLRGGRLGCRCSRRHRCFGCCCGWCRRSRRCGSGRLPVSLVANVPTPQTYCGKQGDCHGCQQYILHIKYYIFHN